MSQLLPPSPLSVSSIIRKRFHIPDMTRDDEIIRIILRMTGEKCKKCLHPIVADHINNVCQVCGCVRKIAKSSLKKGKSILELFDMDAGGFA